METVEASATALIRVIAADDSVVIREGLAAMLNDHPGIDLLAVCCDGIELDRLIARERPDVVIVDIRMPPSGASEGIRIASRLRSAEPQLGVVVISQYIEPEYAIELMGGGTSRRAYLLKDRIADRSELIDAIRAVHAGGSAIDPSVVDVLIQARVQEERSPLKALSHRESQILAEIAQGKSNAAIAESLVLTKRAVEKHVNSIFAKLDLPEPQSASRRVTATLMFLAAEQGSGYGYSAP